MTALTTTPPSAQADPRPTRPGVAWPTVLLLAVVLAAADGFWMTSLRGAVGAISRTQEPFTSYWRTTALMLPAFVLAVLAALTLAFRRYGAELRSRRALVVTGLLVAVAATVTAVGLSAVSAAYDYHLQAEQLTLMQAMPGMGHDCSSTCLDLQRSATVAAHVRAVGYAAAALLATNVVLVGWLVAMAGGRLRVATTGPRVRRSGAPATAGSWTRDVRVLLATGLLASAAIHAAVIPEHLREWLGAAVFFLLLAVAEVAVADRLFQPRQRAALLAAVVVSAVPLVVWTVSRTAGLPFGPEAGAPEAVGLADVVACLLEVGTLVAALVLLRRAGRPERAAVGAHALALALVAVVAVGALGLAGPASAWLDGVDDGADVVQEHHR
ncbi:hypothetical protein SAMN04488543_2017 [Friedmanniella luteola]|uniref:Uncharacterized protein n=1 Tax=Friedmanniella luteola TaxID=546871 RepID=A0A1H1TFU9_9ACTN|nr:hypothetical protein [Friedmanniella luteola]SDS59137.1 hypothetical protein SAMN04488543_2017 [Friedmanniella luteola]